MERLSVKTRSIAEIDQEYRQLGCIGHGGFGSVFLAEKRSSGRLVALKTMRMENKNDEQYETFVRELDAVIRLNTKLSPDKSKFEEKGDTENRDLAIIFFREWFISKGFACIAMNFVDGGTLSDEIKSKAAATPFMPYTERRIAWYALQLCEALAFAHERGVIHHDVKSANVLVDWSAGGRLVLADFGTSVNPGGEAVGFTLAYAAPELLAAYRSGNYSGLNPEKVDAFGIGCILYELLACQMLSHLSGEDQHLAEYVSSDLDAALEVSYIRLPWLPAQKDSASGHENTVGYSDALKNLVKCFLHPNAITRWLPNQLPDPLRKEINSPLLCHHVIAAQNAVTGYPVTVDNVQLGMFVQRGEHWEDGDLDGGIGSIGVVVKLDPDAGYTEVSWPPSINNNSVQRTCCRIGAGRKFEIQVGPTPLPDFYSGTTTQRTSAILNSTNASKYSIGQILNENCVIVGIYLDRNMILVAPTGKIFVDIFQSPDCNPPQITFVPARNPEQSPQYWETQLGTVVKTSDTEERNKVLEMFFAPAGGLDRKKFQVLSIERVQSTNHWNSYARKRELVAVENWGDANERYLFHGTRAIDPKLIIDDPVGFDPRFCDSGLWGRGSYFSDAASYSDRFHHKPKSSKLIRQIFLARVALGKVCQSKPDKHIRRPPQSYHSVAGVSNLDKKVSAGIYVIYDTATQALPEYLITYQPYTMKTRRVIKAKSPISLP